MAREHLEFDKISFYYDSSDKLVFEDLSLNFPRGWTGVLGANGAGKTTLLRLAAGELPAKTGRVLSTGDVVYCPQRTDDAPAELGAFLSATDREACRLKGRLGVADDWAERWGTLSHGERKRAQIGVALWLGAGVLAVDEPTNHVDAQARRLLTDALSSFGGIGLIVSHDRDMLDFLCRQCVMIEPPKAVVRPGGYTKATELARADDERARQEKEKARRELKRLKKTSADRAREAARAYRKRSKRGLGPREFDARAKINLARFTGKDAQAGRVLRQLDGRLEQARERLAAIDSSKEWKLGINLEAEPAKSDLVVRLPAGTLEMGAGRGLDFPELSVAPTDRIAIVGPNGAGKSTLVRHIVSHAGLGERLLYIPQEISLDDSRRIVWEVRGLPRKRLGEVMTFFHSLGSRPERLLETQTPSPGELRKIMLSLGILETPHLVIMDEPTNHLDLPSIECLEKALAACPCALILVSHDTRFLRRLTSVTWEISGGDAGPGRPARLKVVRSTAKGGRA